MYQLIKIVADLCSLLWSATNVTNSKTQVYHYVMMALVTQNILFKVDKLHCGKSGDLKIKNMRSRSAPKLTSYNRENVFTVSRLRKI